MEHLCAICHSNPFKYTCPACAVKTCSVDCIRRHKKQTECTGTVDQSRFIAKKDLSETPVHINRDYNFLIKMGRDIQVGKTDIKNSAKNVFKRPNNSNASRRKKFKPDTAIDPRLEMINQIFQNTTHAIKRMNTLVILLPEGMSRSSNNKTGYDKKLQTFTWSVQWIFTDEEGQVLKDFLSYRINEALTIKEAVPMSVLTGVRETVQQDDLKFYLQNIVRLDGHTQTYIPLDLNIPLCEALKDTAVLEYPTIHVSLKEYSDLIDKERAYTQKPAESSSDSESDSDSDTSSDSSDSSDSDSESESSDEAPEEHSSKDLKSEPAPETQEELEPNTTEEPEHPEPPPLEETDHSKDNSSSI